jgi:hypothetical protein
MDRTKQQSGALRGSAGGKTSNKDGPGLGRSASMAAGSGGVSDPLLKGDMLERVNVLGKQVGAAEAVTVQRAALLCCDAKQIQ